MKNSLKANGVRFSSGLTDSDILKIEEIYGITFPQSLRKFYRDGVPFSEVDYEFPQWNDYSIENIMKIRQRIKAPKEQLMHYLKTDPSYWVPEWGDKPDLLECAVKTLTKAAEAAPPLIPIYLHRYVPVLNNIGDPPILSVAAGFDIIYYGCNLEDYLHREFIENGKHDACSKYMHIPFWSDIINHNEATAAEVRRKGIELGLY